MEDTRGHTKDEYRALPWRVISIHTIAAFASRLQLFPAINEPRFGSGSTAPGCDPFTLS